MKNPSGWHEWKARQRRERVRSAMLHLAAALPLAVLLILLAGPAPAQPAAAPKCASRAKMIGFLARRYGEKPVILGTVNADRVVEILRSAETGTWTILATRADGQTCVIAAGRDWQAIPDAATPVGPEA